VMTHEFGHAYGLDHTSVGASTMIPFIIGDTSQRTLELDDMAGNSDIYPESAARGLSPGAVDFGATTGSVTGTVVSGYNGSAIFGAHVEAINLAAPSTANTVSNISGELTLRNGQGDYSIHGLPPGNYAVRIVPLTGSTPSRVTRTSAARSTETPAAATSISTTASGRGAATTPTSTTSAGRSTT